MVERVLVPDDGLVTSPTPTAVSDQIQTGPTSNGVLPRRNSVYQAEHRHGSVFRSFLSRTLDLLVPPTCPVCQTVVQNDGGLCATCWRDLHWIEEPVCNRLGSPLAYDLGPGAVSAEALANPPEFNRLRAACTYDGVAPRLVHALKHGRQRHLADSLGAMMARAGRVLLEDKHAVLVPVPLHPMRQMQRRYNQSALLARAVGDLTGIEVVYDAVKRVKRTRDQKALSRGDRMRNMESAFKITDKGRALLADRAVVLVDDVHTTGATLNALSETIRSLPGAVRARDVDALVFSTTIVLPAGASI
ncbi:MAG: ComF family protein [Pseudomonadota bacterium]